MMEDIEKEAAQFELDNDDPQAVNAVFVCWVGFVITNTTHRFFGFLNTPRFLLFPPNYQLT